eukprot:Gregarina_sp_Pseudo_9__5941@NODE_958_length_2030_cov_78_376193_g898_i0_p1_GENE_NODE_958_length_2030_cov_78_376193_g898_i0NODE_958_length_2030_cov_78_376193_g898_i0_p1_ORF_typecomplete_len437_score99_88_NODE_958_length_2030_cov_78_376193_g898_i02351545
MKTLAVVALFVLVRGENTLTGTQSVRSWTNTDACDIEQCLNGESPIAECAAAAAEGCGYEHDFVISGKLTDTDICAFPGAATETETPLWLKLDLSATRTSNLADWFTNCAYVSGAMAFQTSKPRDGSDLSLDGFGSPSLECVASPIDSQLGQIALWRRDSNRIEFQDTIAGYTAALFDGKHTMLLNGTSAGLTETAVGAITGFTAEDWRLRCGSYVVGTLPPVSPFQTGASSLADVSGSCLAGCANPEDVASAVECVEAADTGCDFAATYTVTDMNRELSNSCHVNDTTRVILEEVFVKTLGEPTDITGSVFLDMGSRPYEPCQLEVSLLTGNPDYFETGCSLPNVEVASKEIHTVAPDTRTMELTQLPDNFAGVIITTDKDWRFCGGAVNAMRVETLTANLQITSKAPPPDDDPSGSEATLTLAAVSLASLLFFL